MTKEQRDRKRRQISLSRAQIITTAIQILDEAGEAGLTFQVLARRLSTGAGAIYWHVENKGDLMAAACDSLVIGALSDVTDGDTPEETIRAVALVMFDTFEHHPWIGSIINGSATRMAVIRLIERVGAQIARLGVARDKQWPVTSAVLSYILGVAGQNAANAQHAQTQDLDRSAFLSAAAEIWIGLDEHEFPVTRSLAQSLRDHDDRADFIEGVDLIVRGMRSLRPE